MGHPCKKQQIQRLILPQNAGTWTCLSLSSKTIFICDGVINTRRHLQSKWHFPRKHTFSVGIWPARVDAETIFFLSWRATLASTLLFLTTNGYIPTIASLSNTNNKSLGVPAKNLCNLWSTITTNIILKEKGEKGSGYKKWWINMLLGNDNLKQKLPLTW